MNKILHKKYTIPTIFLLINIVFYFSTFSTTLNLAQIALVIATTTLFEYILFVLPNIKNKKLHYLHKAIYTLLSLAKIGMGIYFRQYSSFDVLSRRKQAEYLDGTIDYMFAQITIPNIVLLVLTILATVLLIKKASATTNRKKTLGAIAIYLGLIISTNLFADCEFYQCTFGAMVQPVERLDDICVEEVLSNPIPLFENYNHKNKYTGIGKDKNLLIIQVESLQNSFIGKTYNEQEITPNLNKLINKSFYFTDYFELLGLGNSSDAEWVSMHSAYSTTENGAYQDFAQTHTYGLPKIAKNRGYQTISMHPNFGKYYHRNKHHPEIGFEENYFGEVFEQDEVIGMGLSDKSFFRQAFPILKEKKDEKTLTFIITLTCHTPYYMPEENCLFTDGDENSPSIFKRYLNAVYYTDAVLGDFFQKLEEEGMLENTVVAIYGDHHALMKNDPQSGLSMSEFLGYEYDYDDMLNIPLIIYVPGYEKPVVCDQTGSQLDFLPTILNIMGWNDEVTPMLGVDLLDETLSKDNVVLPQTYIVKGSMITADKLFIKHRREDNLGTLIDRNTREEILNYEGDEFIQRSKREIHFSNYIYYHDLIQDIINEFKEENGIQN